MLSLDVCIVVVFAGALIATFVEIDFAVAVGVMIAAGVEMEVEVRGEARVGIATVWVVVSLVGGGYLRIDMERRGGGERTDCRS